MRKIISFLKEARAELGKVIWPTRRRAFRLTFVVVIITVLFGAFIGAVDYGLSHGVEYVISVSKRPTPPGQSVQIPAGSANQPIQVPAGGTQPNQPNQPPSK